MKGVGPVPVARRMRLQYRTQRLHTATEQYNAPTVHFSRDNNETRKNRKRPGQTTKKKTTKRRLSLKPFVRRQETGNPHKRFVRGQEKRNR